VRTRLVDDHGRTVRPGPDTSVVNGGPQLVRDGQWDVTLRRDGMVQTDNPGFLYGWAVKRNPRTFAGVDAQGRTVLVTADGRSTADLGLSIPETADVARSLGLTNAINLDGGGSTAMAVDGGLITHPSDATGERAVGDALLVLPQR
jgi:exopolysaccharide biosynthesis protein